MSDYKKFSMLNEKCKWKVYESAGLVLYKIAAVNCEIELNVS